MVWTKKHDKFALATDLSASQCYVLRDLLRKSNKKELVEIEFDLRKTNKWIGKQRLKGEYHRKTICNSIPALEEKTQGMVTVLQRYSPYIYKILVRPLAYLEAIKGAKEDKKRNLNCQNPMYSEDHKNEVLIQQQRNISKLDVLFTKLGMKFSYDALLRIWRLSGKNMNEITKSIELLLHRHSTGTTAIKNPEGFINQCLKFNWQKNFDINDFQPLPTFQSSREITEYIRQIFSDTGFVT